MRAQLSARVSFMSTPTFLSSWPAVLVYQFFYLLCSSAVLYVWAGVIVPHSHHYIHALVGVAVNLGCIVTSISLGAEHCNDHPFQCMQLPTYILVVSHFFLSGFHALQTTCATTTSTSNTHSSFYERHKQSRITLNADQLDYFESNNVSETQIRSALMSKMLYNEWPGFERHQDDIQRWESCALTYWAFSCGSMICCLAMYFTCQTGLSLVPKSLSKSYPILLVGIFVGANMITSWMADFMTRSFDHRLIGLPFRVIPLFYISLTYITFTRLLFSDADSVGGFVIAALFNAFTTIAAMLLRTIPQVSPHLLFFC